MSKIVLSCNRTGQYILTADKYFCLGQKQFCLGQICFVLDKNYFVRTEGRGIRLELFDFQRYQTISGSFIRLAQIVQMVSVGEGF